MEKNKNNSYAKLWALIAIISLNAFVFNPWIKFPYTFVIIIAAAFFITIWQFKSLTKLGFKTSYSFKKIIIISILLFLFVELFVDIFLQPFTNWLTNEPQDYTAFSILKGNTSLYIKYIFFIWISAAFGEEILFRGFLFQQFNILIPRFKYKLVIIVLLSSILFAIPHFYLGWSGVFFTFLFGIIFSLIYIKCDYNLWICIIVHGLVDTVFITLAYTDNLEYYKCVNNWFY